MRILVFSDVHSNDKNIQKVLKSEIYDRCIFAGDLFGYFQFEYSIFDVLKHKETDFVLGNHDIYFIREAYPALFTKRFSHLNKAMLSSEEYDKKYGILNATLSRYPDLDLKFFENSDTTKRVRIDNTDILICHGSPDNPFDGYVYPDYEDFDGLFNNYVFDILILGHTHKHFCVEKAGRYIMNPGSCTLPRGADKPSYSIIDTTNRSISINEVEQTILFKRVTSNKIELI
jgi:putative phosphoesterase